MVGRVAVWAAGKVGGLSPVPSEPLRARWSLGRARGVFFSYCVTGRNGTDHVFKLYPCDGLRLCDQSNDNPTEKLTWGVFFQERQRV